MHNILLPLGISFFTFQQVSFIVDRCQHKAEHYPFIDYVTFVTFFPQLVAGPIVLYKEMMPQFADKHLRNFNRENFAKGIALFTLGLSKKVLLADVLALPVNYGFTNTAGELQFPLQGLYRQGTVAEMAYHPVPFLYPVCVYSPWWKP